jgi:histidine triad (HIT) family protein
MSSDCIFCRIVRGELPADTVYQDEHVTAFRDIEPQAPTHVLVIPNYHYDSLNDAAHVEGGVTLLGRLLRVAALVARDEGVEETGYRVLTNVGQSAGQSVAHLHLHVLGGRRLNMTLG